MIVCPYQPRRFTLNGEEESNCIGPNCPLHRTMKRYSKVIYKHAKDEPPSPNHQAIGVDYDERTGKALIRYAIEEDYNYCKLSKD